MTSYNWKDLQSKAQNVGALPNGKYDVRVTLAKYQPTQTGKDMYKVRYEVVSGPQAGNTVWNNFVISPENPNALGFFFRHMNAMGLSQNFFDQNPSHEQVCAALEGKYAVVDVEETSYNGQPSNNVKAVYQFTGGQPAAEPFPGAPAAATTTTPDLGGTTPAPQPQPAPEPAPQPSPEQSNGVAPTLESSGPKLPF